MSSLIYQAKIQIDSLSSLSRFAERLALVLQPGDVVALDGNLGAGKTTLTQQLGKALGLTEPVSSPTFVLMNEYHSGKFPIVHVDLYRLGEERSESLADELYAIIDEGRSLVMVEWACYGPFLEPVITMALQIDYATASDESESTSARCITMAASRPLEGLMRDTP